MDKVEARQLLDHELLRLRALSYEELQSYMVEEHREVIAPSGKEYQIEKLALWDSGKEGNLRVIVSIDDGGLLTAMKPMTDGFLLSPEGSFLGE